MSAASSRGWMTGRLYDCSLWPIDFSSVTVRRSPTELLLSSTNVGFCKQPSYILSYFAAKSSVPIHNLGLVNFVECSNSPAIDTLLL